MKGRVTGLLLREQERGTSVLRTGVVFELYKESGPW